MDVSSTQRRVSELTEYQEWAVSKAGGGFTSDEAGQYSPLLNGALGLAGEAGEFANSVKKIAFHGKEYTEDAEEHLVDELGDALWYIANIAHSMGYTLEQVADANRVKLDARYPDGFDSAFAPDVRS